MGCCANGCCTGLLRAHSNGLHGSAASRRGTKGGISVASAIVYSCGLKEWINDQIMTTPPIPAQGPQFPADWPQGCPPSTATPASGNWFRIVKGLSFVDDDFKNYAELGKGVNVPECKRRGVSVYDSEANAKRQMEARPYIGKFVAKGTLSHEHGVTSPVSATSGHAEWWPFDGIDRASCFEEPSV